MRHRLIPRLLGGALVVLTGLAAATPAHAGPPWISLELPANPHESSTRGAFFLVHTYHHGTPTEFPLTGTAEGIVNGRRQSVRLEIVPTGKPGVFAVRYRPTGQGTWVLALHLGNPGRENAAGMLVSLDREGGVSRVEVPSRTTENGRWVVPRGVTGQDVDAALSRQHAMNQPDTNDHTTEMALGTLGLLAGLTVLGRRQRSSRK